MSLYYELQFVPTHHRSTGQFGEASLNYPSGQSFRESGSPTWQASKLVTLEADRWDSQHGHCHPWEWGWCPRKGSSSQAPAAKWDAKCSTSAHTSYFRLKTIGTAETSRPSDWTTTGSLVFPQERGMLHWLKDNDLLTTRNSSNLAASAENFC